MSYDGFPALETDFSLMSELDCNIEQDQIPNRPDAATLLARHTDHYLIFCHMLSMHSEIEFSDWCFQIISMVKISY
jgi:hypothetical protein